MLSVRSFRLLCIRAFAPCSISFSSHTFHDILNPGLPNPCCETFNSPDVIETHRKLVEYILKDILGFVSVMDPVINISEQPFTLILIDSTYLISLFWAQFSDHFIP